MLCRVQILSGILRFACHAFPRQWEAEAIGVLVFSGQAHLNNLEQGYMFVENQVN